MILTTFLFLSACIKPPPPAPAVPKVEVPRAPDAFTGDIDLPKPTIEERFEADMVRPLPLRPGSSVVLVLPDKSVTFNKEVCGAKAGADGGAPALDACLLDTRTALLAAFLEEGFRVKDAGTIAVPTMKVRRWPATEKKTEILRTVEDDGTETVTETKQRDHDWWWRQEGLLLSLKDPTSLWGPELVGYRDLKADAFFRVFSIDISKGTQSARGLLEFSDDQLADFDRQAAAYNTRLNNWRQQRQEVVDDLERIEETWRTYEVAYDRWRRQYQEAISRHAVRVDGPKAAPRVRLPELPEPATREMLNQAVTADKRSIERLQGRLIGELVDAETGEVLWIGEVSGAVDASRYARRKLLHGMLRTLRGLTP